MTPGVFPPVPYHLTYTNAEKRLSAEIHFLLLNKNHFMNLDTIDTGFTEELTKARRTINILWIIAILIGKEIDAF